MSKFAVYLEGKGEGCDYTIGCNRRVIFLNATTLDQAQIAVVKILEDYGIDDRENRINKIIILEGVQHIFDHKDWLKKEIEAEKTREEQAQEAKERAELKRLKEKYKQ